jgi:hypothetical protein
MTGGHPLGRPTSRRAPIVLQSRREVLRDVEALAAFFTAVRPHRQKELNPKFQEPATFRSIDKIGPATRPRHFRGVRE